MKIQQYGPLGRPAGTRPANRAGQGGAFSAHLSEQAEETGNTASSAPMTGVGALLLAQEDDEQQRGRTLTVIRAETMLEQLDGIRLALLSGGLPQERLLNLQKLVASRRPGLHDPQLLQVLNDIELRVRVELAKQGL
jgi:hypothetical protein